MKNNLLLPYSWKKYAWVVLAISILLGIVGLVTEFSFLTIKVPVFILWGSSDFFKGDNSLSITPHDITDELIGLLILVSAFVVAFSKEKEEDEYIEKLRLDSLLIATYINTLLIALSLILVYGIEYLNIMMFNLYSILFIFIIRFNYILHIKKGRYDEK